MVHIDYKSAERLGRTPAEWLPVGASIARFANKFANREDLVAYIGEDATGGIAPALFKPAVAEIEINVKKAFGFGVTPEIIGEIESRSTQYEFPRAVGAILHEAYHARFSQWSIPDAQEDLAADEFKALMQLEESRIEALGTALNPEHIVFIRACVMDLVIGDVTAEKMTQLTPALAAQLVALVDARIIAGILDEVTMEEVTSIVRGVLGNEAHDRLREIVAEFQGYHNHYNVKAAYPLAIEWAKIIRDLNAKAGAEDSEDPGEGGSGEGEEGEEGEEGQEGNKGGMSEELSELFKKLRDAADEVEIANATELGDQEDAEEWAERLAEKKADAREQGEAQEAAVEVFGKSTGPETGNGTYSKLINRRAPEGKERAAAVTIARLLEKAKYRDRDVTVATGALPKGRLRMRAVVQNEALRAAGALGSAAEWKFKTRKQTDEPKLSIGVMVDISGSMYSAMEPMAVTAWAMSEAAKRVQGRTAMVYYGQDVFPTLKPGQHLPDIHVWSAEDPTEKFNKAFKALDGSLNLLHGTGVRLLVVVSDGQYVSSEMDAAKRWMRRCQEAGVAVLWLPFTRDRWYVDQICRGTNSVVLAGALNPADAAMEIGKAAAKALEISNLAKAV